MQDGCETSCAQLDPTDPGDAGGDLDGDGLTNLVECQEGSSPCEFDDVLGPEVESISPADGAADVATGTEIVINFDEPVRANTVNNNTIVVFAGTTRVSRSFVRSGDNRTVTLRGALESETPYSVFVTTGVLDVDGNSGAPFNSSFTTGAAPDTRRPRVAVMRPAPGASGVAVDKCVTLFFDEPVDAATVTDASFRLTDTRTNNPVSGTISVDSTGTSATICPDSGLVFNTSIRVNATTAIQDLAGNTLGNFSTTYRTALDPSTSRPTVVEIRPSSGTTGIPTNAQVLARFSEALDPATVSDTSFQVTINSTGAVHAGTLTLEAGGTVVRYAPDSPYPASAAMM